ncbi:cag [Carabus blaptoides fortunei]
MNDTESTKNPKRRKTITFEQKLEIIKKSERGEKLASIGRSLGLTRSTINTIVKDKERIKTHIKDGLNIQLISASRARSTVMEEMERLLKLWLDAQNKKNVPLSLSIIQEKARQIHAVLKYNMGQSSADTETFNASWGWFRRFKIRANLHHFKMTGDAASADINAANEFREKLKRIIDEGGYCAQQIFNIGVTGLFWKKMPPNTYISNEEKHVAKDRLTLLLGGNASGDFKLTPMLVYHSETPRAFRGITKSSLPVIWKSNCRARITVALFENWFKNHFVPSTN